MPLVLALAMHYTLRINLSPVGNHAYALVIGSETMSRLVDWQDRATCILFGDGAGAALLAADSTPGILASQISAQGRICRFTLHTKQR